MFGLSKGHMGLSVRTPVLEDKKSELKMYTMTKPSLHVPLEREIPDLLVKKLVKAATRMNEGGSA